MEKFMLRRLLFRKLLFIIIALTVHTGYAQFSPEFDIYKDQFPSAKLVRINQETSIQVGLINGEIDILQHFVEEDLYLDESATYNSAQSLSFSAFFEMEDVEAYSLNFERGKYREYKVENYKKKDDLDRSFYDDAQSLNFIYPDLKKGSKTKLIYSEKVKNPRFLSPFFFADFTPIVNNKFTITADKNINFEFRKFNTDSLEITYSEEEKRGNKIYTWEVKNTKEYKYESQAPNYKNILPHIIPIITSYNNNGQTVNLQNDVSDLYDWYYSLVENINKEEDDKDLVKLVEELTADKETDLEKVKAIYYWTQNNIKYIDFEYALGGFIPREANDVFQKKYGDCKDNSSILLKMLSIAGLEGNLTWIGTRDIPYSYSEVPTPMVDNHMILSFTDKDETYFLDATGRFMPMDLPSSFIQGKEALISEGKEKFRIQKVPVIPANRNALVDTTHIVLVGEALQGRSRAEISGYYKLDYFQNLENLSTDSKNREFYNAMLQKGNNKFLIKEFSEVNKYDYDKNFIVDYNFGIDGYAKNFGQEIYLNLNLNKDLSFFKTEENRKHEVEYDYKSSYNYTTILEIPEGYALEYLPENVQISNNFLNSSVTYNLEDNKIIYNHKADLNFLILDLAQQKEVNALIKQMDKAYQEIIILKKINSKS
ncbi:DUF3857 domain-containing protein [Salegentibacter sp. F188]|uniref:DUF3857 domain-containing protein n=1 Tax=Autumnicola patrickiae TaxID=3075591 RepID=A0ABU3E2Q5_9FLAO|nr:DUF3857 domain-containing protein [Salegentibacter sp. F188]MDT0690262.1 DUF3857 domain-containing protein [Salegentibacter sp. F188]